ncbi:MAG: type II toxin-antitoxin system VapC family toxin [Bauldia sp.]
MILVDTSIWIDHLREGAPLLENLLAKERVMAHPFVIGELALGALRQREVFLQRVRELPSALVASHDEVLTLILGRGLSGSGIGYVDAHLIASVRMTPNARLWTRDQKLAAVVERLGLLADPHDA